MQSFQCSKCYRQIYSTSVPDKCPHCGVWFSSVKCTSCGYSGAKNEFASGSCPKCYSYVDISPKPSYNYSPSYGSSSAASTASQESISPRPVLLKVLCILTFIGSAMQLASGIFALFAGESVTAIISTVYIFSAILCFTGALMMWQLKKNGFYIYIAGQLVGLLFPFLMNRIEFSNLSIELVISLIIPIVFVFLYYLNFKSLD